MDTPERAAQQCTPSATCSASAAACHATLLTPPGRGAVATVAVVGPVATHVVGQLFRPISGRPLAELPLHRIVFGHWDAGELMGEAGPAAGEELVVCRLAPEWIEVHCHGGSAAVHQVLASLAALGCPRRDPRRWVAGHEPDALVADARWALALARTENVAAVLLDQYRGALSAIVRQVIEDVDAARYDAAQRQLETVLQWARFGLHLMAAWRVVLAGRANVGKSSLLNALLGFQRALVFHEAGTTRDVLTATTAVNGWPVEFADTAGIRTDAGELESAGIARAHQQVARADLVLVVTDGSQPWTQEDAACLDACRDRALIVHNKRDLLGPARGDRAPLPAPLPDTRHGDDSERLWTSALTGDGIPVLLQAIARRLFPAVPPPGAAVPFYDHHVRRLRLACRALDAREPGRARRWLTLLQGLQ